MVPHLVTALATQADVNGPEKRRQGTYGLMSSKGGDSIVLG